MNEYRTDEEQTDLVFKWVKKYGPSILIGIVLALGLSYAYNRWQAHRVIEKQAASTLYDNLLVAFEKKDTSDFQSIVSTLQTQYSKTSYASFAALLQAKLAVENNDLKAADTHLQWAINHAPNAAFKEIAQLRSARVLIGLEKPQGALDLLSILKANTPYHPIVENIKGDAWEALKEPAKARAAYQLALISLPQNAELKGLIEMKLNQLPLEKKTA